MRATTRPPRARGSRPTLRAASLRWLLCGAALIFVASNAAANWPMARHDPKRTGAATGASDLTTPVPYWRAYLGGSIGPGQLGIADVDGDGNEDLLFATSGRVVARRTDDTAIWASKPYGLSGISAIVDLDGDGQLELVLSGYDPSAGGWRTRIVDPMTGADLVPALAGQRYFGTAAMEATDRRQLITGTGNSVLAWSFRRAPTATVTHRWTLADRAINLTLSTGRHAQGGRAQELLR